MNRHILACLMFSMILLVPSGAQALWETHQGSDSRPSHCEPIPDPAWNPPGLAWVHTKSQDRPSDATNIEGAWVIPAAGVKDADEAQRLLITLAQGGRLEAHTENFSKVYSTNMGGFMYFVELMDVDGAGVPQIMISPRGPALFDLQGELIRTYHENPPPMTFSSYMWPAMGDFSQTGGVDLVFLGSWEWRAFRGSGELIARSMVIEEKDIGGWTSAVGHREDGRDYVYLVTANEYLNDEGWSGPHHSRLHKLTLEPIPGTGQLFSGKEILPLTNFDPLMPYRFQHVWMREFHVGAGDDQLRFYDLTGDGREEVILPHLWWPDSEVGAFTILNRDGIILYQHPLLRYAQVAIGDTNGNGVPEVVALAANFDYGNPDRVAVPSAIITAVEWNGQHFEEIYRREISEEFGGRFLALCDVNGDGSDEILVALGEGAAMRDELDVPMGEGMAMLLTGNGSVLWDYRFFFGAPWRGLLIDDFTGDGAYEFIITTQAGQVLVFSPHHEPSLDDYKRVFDALLHREYHKPSSEQVEEWLLQLGWEPEAESVDGDKRHSQTDGAVTAPLFILPALVLVGVAILVLARMRRS